MPGEEVISAMDEHPIQAGGGVGRWGEEWEGGDNAPNRFVRKKQEPSACTDEPL